MADNENANRELGNGKQAYMNRMFCTTKERISYILYSAFGTMSLGKYDPAHDSDLWLYQMYGVSPNAFAKASIGLSIYDMVNDPLTAAIIDNMRTRWGKFKPFQYLSLLPSIALGIYICMLPLMAQNMGLDAGQKLFALMVYKFANETVGAFFGGGGYINNVFTPNPNERTSLLVSAKFVGDLLSKFPEQVMSVILDITSNGIVNASASLTKTFVVGKWIVWIFSMVPTVLWYINSRERVAQSEKPPHPLKGIMAVFKNKPLLISTLRDLIDGINVESSSSLYYANVLNFNMLPTIAGIPGSPISYASYGFAPKFRARFSTKTLWFLCRGTQFFREAAFFLVGCIGGKEHGLYLKKLPMALTYAIGNSAEMCFYATKKIIDEEINFEVLDYCEWKNGYRVEATITTVKNYFTKFKDMILKVINARLLETWAGFKIGENQVQTLETKYRLFLTAFGPKLIFDAFCFIPMIFYNIDKSTRERMYLDLEQMRSLRANMELMKDSTDEEILDSVSDDK